jgi:cyclic beta-1,2-glucan synthetase
VPDEPPLRAELFSVTQLEQHARMLAGWHKVSARRGRGDDALLPRLDANEVTLRQAHTLITEAVKRGTRITPAAEWFIDNYHLIEEQIRTTRRHLPRGYYRELPRLTNGPSTGTPRVYDLALELISHSHGRLDMEGLRAFVASYQSVCPLRLGELWAIPIMLRLALLENLRRVVASVTAGRRDRARAAHWVEQMLEAAADPAKVVLILAELVKVSPPLTNAFVAEFATRLQGPGGALVFPISWLEQRLAAKGQTVEQVFQLVGQNQATDQVAVGNSITSLRLLGATDWRGFVEAMSVVERTLHGDPSGDYARMDFATRDRYRLVVEDISKRSPLSEDEVARAAIRLASDAGTAARGSAPRDCHAQRKEHVGFFLVDEGRAVLERSTPRRRRPHLRLRDLAHRLRFVLYGGSLALVTALGVGILALAASERGASGWALGAAVAVFTVCASQPAVAVVHWAVTLLVRPKVMPRLDFSGGIPPEHRAVVAVPAMLTDAAEVDGLIEALEIRFLANRDRNLSFALLSDFRDASAETTSTDDALLLRARGGIEALNAQYETEEHPAPFFLFHRARQWNPRQGVWMGWERKRGKLKQFNAALRGTAQGFHTIVGDLAVLQTVKYVIALDSDTQLPRDCARQLVGTLAHPLNRPCIDERVGRVTSGYAILQPRVATTMASAWRSRFARLFAGDAGIDPYTRAVSDVYQDLFHEGSFVGKGIYDVDAFQRTLAGRLPENRILSHDLLEGAHARAGLVSDITLFDDYPSAYLADVSRRDRWMRGDWQIAPWLRSRVPGGGNDPTRRPNPISRLSQWKVLDNLRRSLLPVALMALLLAGWLTPGAALFATGAVAAILLLPGLLTAAAELGRRPTELPRRRHLDEIKRAFVRQALREGFALAVLPYEAFVAVVAIVRTTIRVSLTNRLLLEWRTASDAQRSTSVSVFTSYARMWVAPVVALAAAAGVAARSPAALLVAVPLLVLWTLAPALAWWLSQPLVVARARLDTDDRRFLRVLARRTWRFFETFVGAEDNHLPPDNVQEDPPRGAAHRTSPTNIGLSLTASLAAYDFGYVSAGKVIECTTLTLASMDKLQRYRGHFYNWYDTRTLKPLRPMYVSTVDSGNLAGHLLTLAAGFDQMADDRIFRGEIFSGLGDTLDVAAELEPRAADARASIARLRSDLESPPSTLSGARMLLDRLIASSRELVRVGATAAQDELTWWARAFESQCRHASDELTWMAPWLQVRRPLELGELRAALVRLDEPPTLAQTARLEQTLAPAFERALAAQPAASGANGAETCDRVSWLQELRDAVRVASERASARLVELRQLAIRCSELADLEYDFLYDRDRRLLTIGYNVGDHQSDPGFYDLLASEARLASFVGIAQGKLPQEHWFSLGRLLTTAGDRPSLLSWSGSMFEYLMPLLVMPTHDDTILDETYRGVVERQIEYGGECGLPWGVSESGYNKTDADLNYQYRAFGVPGLGFKRGLAADLVVAPYASAMALMVAPEVACTNLRRLSGDGALGAYGFFEAVDYTPARLPRGKERVVVRSFMAHHQGMTLLSLAYVLLDRPMQRRFASNRAFQATALLLQERVPRAPALYPHPAEVSAGGAAVADAGGSLRVFTTPNTSAPAVHLLSNGAYHVVITNAGGGYSRWRDLAVTRWREDPTRDCWGSFCYLRDVTSGRFWSVAHQPSLKPASSYEAIYSQGRAEFRRRDGHIDTHVEISVSPEDDIELRRVSVTNRGRTPRTIELTSFAEVVLAPPAADAAHPAFHNLFVQTELVRARQAILCTRRPRSAGDRPPWLMHLMAVHGPQVGTTSYETARAEFIGRGRSALDPAAMHQETLTNSEGAVLDPVVAIRNTVLIQPDETVRIHVVTGMAETREQALSLIEKYSDRHSADRVFELSWTHNQVALRQLDVTEADTQLYDRLASNVLYADPTLRAPRSVIARNRRGQSALWAYSISGDLPIVLLRIADRDNLGLVRQLVKAHAYWRLKGLRADLVIWNEDTSGYRQTVQEEILAVAGGPSEASLLDRPGGIFVRRSDQLTEEDKGLMLTVARLVVSDRDGPLVEQMKRRVHNEMPPLLLSGKEHHPEPVEPDAHADPDSAEVAPERPDLSAFNGLGGFTLDGREYVITTTRRARTPAPWVNVMANPWFGTVISESGGAYTWCENAHSYRLTPWHNDPVSDPSGEAFYIRDETDGHFWSPTPLPAGGASPYTTRHGFGYTVFEQDESGITTELRTFVATDAPLKFMVFKVRNHSGRQRRLSLTGFFELVLGSQRSANLPHVVTEVDAASGALLARNAYVGEFATRVAFLDCSEGSRSMTGDRTEFLGRNGSPSRPACMSRARLSGRTGAGLDACMAMQIPIDLADGQEREVVFTFGSGCDLGDARTLLDRFRGTGAAAAAFEAVCAYWKSTLGAVHVQTPDATVNHLANGWLLYQVLASRMWARSGFYQSGGAFGFRDQLQDAMSLVHAEPAILREQIVRSASRQFAEGDVQHWWHPPAGRGVRTRISDDYLWLPYALCRYVTAVGDTGVMDEQVPFLEGRAVQATEDSYYDLPARSDTSATVYQHCVRAIEHGLRFGDHGLPLIGTGDWNDGMNLVGDQGKGESVWLAFFLYDVLLRFGELARLRNDSSISDRCALEATRLRGSIERHGWDGAWYRRAYFDNGAPLGSSTNPECQIDSLPQSWSVLSGAGSLERSRQALAALDQRLVKRELGLIALFEPPFDASDLEPGYVKGYLPGVRENGGQYTHAAVWAVMAFAEAGDAERAWELFGLINPIGHGHSAAAIATYKVEPYVVAADVYMNPQHAGRGGWTWYTGSAGWMYRLVIESLLGVHLEVDRLRVEPLVPHGWGAFDVHYRYRQTVYHIHVRDLGGPLDPGRTGRRPVTRVTCDGVAQPDCMIPLRDDRVEHHAEIDIDGPGTPASGLTR